MSKPIFPPEEKLDYGEGVTSSAKQDQFPLLEAFQAPGDSASQLVLCVLRTASLLDRVVARALAPFNLHHAQFNALVLLKREQESGLRPSALGDCLCVSRPNVTKLLTRLKSRSLIVERPDPADGRAVLAFITQDGERLVNEAFQALTRDLEVAVSTLPQEQGLALRELLDQFRNGLYASLRSAGCGPASQTPAF